MSGPHPLVARARTCLTALALPAGTPVVVACSGGADSLALAATAAFVAPRAGWVARAVTVDHRLREDSARHAAAAARLCEGLGLPAEVIAVEVAGAGRGTGEGPEAAARAARYGALDAAAAGALILLGHTMDDQAETVLLGLARGSGARSLAGMAPRAGNLARPFLPLRRAETEGICQILGLTPLADPTNELDGPWRKADGGALPRSALRHRAIPELAAALGADVVPALARTADLLRRDADHLEDLAHQAGQQARAGAVAAGGQFRYAVEKLKELPAAVRSRVIHGAIMESAGRARGSVSSAHTRAVDELIVNYHGQGATALPGGARAYRQGGWLTVQGPKETRKEGSSGR